MDHLHKQPMQEQRNMLIESARILRGDVRDLASADPEDYSAAIFPGGFGAATHWCDFATRGAEMTVLPEILAFATALHAAKKPLGFICIAPVLIPKICQGARMTLGDDPSSIEKVQSMGARHQNARVDEVVVDDENKIVSTPAYMLATRITEVQAGIAHLVEKVLALTYG